jgi:hypothetical protein
MISIKVIMKSHFLLIIVLMGGCRSYNNVTNDKTTHEAVWVYLGGLTAEPDSEQEGNWCMLEHISQRLNSKFIIIPPKYRCAHFDNRFCWPHETKEELQETYHYIQECTQGMHVSGYIGFSNGGFFLSALMQEVPINQHIVLIGAGGQLKSNARIHAQSITLIIGKNDFYHYVCSKKFAQDLKDNSFPVTLIEYDGGHEIPEYILEDRLKTWCMHR